MLIWDCDLSQFHNKLKQEVGIRDARLTQAGNTCLPARLPARLPASLPTFSTVPGGLPLYRPVVPLLLELTSPRQCRRGVSGNLKGRKGLREW